MTFMNFGIVKTNPERFTCVTPNVTKLNHFGKNLEWYIIGKIQSKTRTAH